MKNETRWKSILTGVAIAGVAAGVIGGFLAANLMMGDMKDMEGMEGMKGMQDMPMKGMEMAGMPGMGGEAGAVAIPVGTRQLIGVRSAPAGLAELAQEIRTVGIVEYDERNLAKVTLKVSGWVQEVFVDSVGRPVRKGEPLFTLYSPDLLATQDEYLLALKARDDVASSPLAEVKAEADALVASARERLRLWDLTDEQIAALERRGKAEPVLRVYAPLSGIVLEREAVPGKYVEPGIVLYEVADLSRVWIFVDIYESEVAAVKLHQPASVEFAAYPGETFRAEVAYIYPTLNTEARTVRVRLELPNPNLRLKLGMYGNVTIRTTPVKTLVVPKEAVLDTGLRQLVFLDRGEGVYLPYPVKLGRRSQEYVEVLEGIKEGDRIVTSANFLLDAESKLASAGSMQAMMGRIGMADWQMRGAREATMEGMEGMEGMKPGPVRTVSETRQVSGFSLTLTTVPEKPRPGETLLRLKVTDQAGKPVPNAQVVFFYTMPMPGMVESKATGTHAKDGVYEAKAMLGMGGTWEVTAKVMIPGQPPISEKFRFAVAGGGM